MTITNQRILMVAAVVSVFPFCLSSCVSPLMSAVARNDTQSVNHLISNGASINGNRKWKITPLEFAILNKKIDMVKFLLDKGADINAVSINGWTALMYAAYYNHMDMIKLLLDRGADASIATPSGETALSIATSGGYQQIANLIRSALAKQSQSPIVTATPSSPHPSPLHSPLAKRERAESPIGTMSQFGLPQGEREVQKETPPKPKAATPDWW